MNLYWKALFRAGTGKPCNIKSGGFNPISSESPLLVNDPGLKDFDPEYINSIEVGVKSRLFSESLQVNLSYFYYDYEDMQIAKFVEAVALNENVDASIQGIEAEFLYAPNSQWLFGLDAAWLDTEIDDFSTVNPTNPNQLGTTDLWWYRGIQILGSWCQVLPIGDPCLE